MVGTYLPSSILKIAVITVVGANQRVELPLEVVIHLIKTLVRNIVPSDNSGQILC